MPDGMVLEQGSKQNPACLTRVLEYKIGGNWDNIQSLEAMEFREHAILHNLQMLTRTTNPRTVKNCFTLLNSCDMDASGIKTDDNLSFLYLITLYQTI